VLSVIAVVITVWIENTQAILVAYGLIAAGIAISLQDFFKGFAGGILILFNNIYRVGDRVQLGQVYGDVMDIGIFYTTLMETRGWVGGDQASGRIVMISNAKVLTDDIFNYTKDHSFLWDEICIPLTYDSNWSSIISPIHRITNDEVASMTEKASSEIARIGEKYYLPKKDVQPMVYVNFDSSWINIHVRFVTEARSRRLISDRLHRKILNEISKHRDVKIAQAQIESWKLGEGP
jgi:small-conductance mechanosensitive channel